jgi:hypothetical protein
MHERVLRPAFGSALMRLGPCKGNVTQFPFSVANCVQQIDMTLFLRVYIARRATSWSRRLQRSWTMNFWWLRYFPTKYIWDPRLSFTGVTILGYNVETGALSPNTLHGSQRGPSCHVGCKCAAYATAWSDDLQPVAKQQASAQLT